MPPQRDFFPFLRREEKFSIEGKKPSIAAKNSFPFGNWLFQTWMEFKTQTRFLSPLDGI